MINQGATSLLLDDPLPSASFFFFDRCVCSGGWCGWHHWVHHCSGPYAGGHCYCVRHTVLQVGLSMTRTEEIKVIFRLDDQKLNNMSFVY